MAVDAVESVESGARGAQAHLVQPLLAEADACHGLRKVGTRASRAAAFPTPDLALGRVRILQLLTQALGRLTPGKG